jgi:hypothetical protein
MASAALLGSMLVAARGAGRMNGRALHKPRDRKVAITRSWAQPAWQRTSTWPSSASLIDRLGWRSSCAGQLAIQVVPTLRPPSALAMVLALIAGLAVEGGSYVRRC